MVKDKMVKSKKRITDNVISDDVIIKNTGTRPIQLKGVSPHSYLVLTEGSSIKITHLVFIAVAGIGAIPLMLAGHSGGELVYLHNAPQAHIQKLKDEGKYEKIISDIKKEHKDHDHDHEDDDDDDEHEHDS